jgi:DNA-directed RNA polymerase subunit beta'
LSRFIIVDSPDEKKQPTIEIKDKSGKVTRKYHMPSHTHLMVQNGETVEAGDVLAKIPRETTKTKDITGGLPRVVELFEARKPKDPAGLAAYCPPIELSMWRTNASALPSRGVNVFQLSF